MQQTDIALGEVIATQHIDMPVQATLPVKHEVKVRCDENDVLVFILVVLCVSIIADKSVVRQFLFFCKFSWEW